jgi:type II pantothenate kinase
LALDTPGREYWVNLFCRHFELVETLIAEEFPSATAADLANVRAEYEAEMWRFRDKPQQFERADVMKLTELRRDVLRKHGFDDPFRGLKRRENEAALQLLPEVLRELHGLPTPQQATTLMAGLMAGNVFERYQAGESGFRRAISNVPPRPWFIDDLDRWIDAWLDGSGFEHVLFFLDNAGSDACLGCVPLARWMLERGTRVSLAANSGPALNDITYAELLEIMPRIASLDATIESAWRDGRLRITPTGSSLPLLDLADLSPQCVALAQTADLVILHGMGRAIESNFDVPLNSAALRTAVLKDPAVAAHLGANLFDCVCRFTPRAGRAGSA